MAHTPHASLQDALTLNCRYAWVGAHSAGGMMAARLVEVRVGDVVLAVETTPVAGTELTSRLDRVQASVGDAFDQARAAIVAVAESTIEVIDRLGGQSRHPEQVEVSFGLKFSANGGVIVAGVSAEAALEVKLTYKLAEAAPA